MTTRRTEIFLVASVLVAAAFGCGGADAQSASGNGHNQVFRAAEALPMDRAEPVRPFSWHRKSELRPVPKVDLALGDRLPWLPDAPPKQRKTIDDLIIENDQPPAKEPQIGKDPELPADAPAASVPPPVRAKPSLDQMIGQMIVVGFRGTKPDDPGVAAIRRQIGKGVIGGVMVMGHNVIAPGQTAKLNGSILAAAPRRDLRPIISVDQEGGFVQRLSQKNGHRAYPSAWAVANDAKYNSNRSRMKVYDDMARELRVSGFNTNFGPVVDLDLHPQNPIIGRYKRSFGAKPSQVMEYARIFASAHRDEGLLTSAKHFPGHGSSRADSHKGFTDISKWWEAIELEPYRDLASDPYVDMVMVGHLYHPDFSDAPGRPASLSRKSIDALRNLGFKGVVVTDDMEMGALRKNFGFEEAIVKAVSAGVDILLYSNTAEPSAQLGPRIHGVIRKAVEDGRIDPKRINDAYNRIVAMKAKLTRDKRAVREESAQVPVDVSRDAVH